MTAPCPACHARAGERCLCSPRLWARTWKTAAKVIRRQRNNLRASHGFPRLQDVAELHRVRAENAWFREVLEAIRDTTSNASVRELARAALKKHRPEGTKP